MKKVVNVVLWIIFLLSFVPYLILVQAAIFGANVGIFNTSWAYGFEAVYVLIYLFTIIPIFPACLIYEFIYGIIMFRKFTKLKKWIAIILPSSIVLLIVLPCIFHEIDNRYQDRIYYGSHEELIWDYLHENFSEELLVNGELELRSREDEYYWFKFDKEVFGEIGFLQIWINEEGDIVDDFSDRFNEIYEEDLGEYLDTYYGVAGNMELQPLLYDVDMSNYSYQDDIKAVFEKCDYRISSVYFTEKVYDQDQTIALIKSFYKEVLPMISVQDEQSFNFYVKVDDRFFASIHAYDKNPSDNEIILFFSGYTYTSEEGETIPSSEMTMILD